MNKAQDEEDALDSSTMPICICPPTRMGVRCEIFHAPPPSTNPITTTSTTSTVSTTTTPAIAVAMATGNSNNTSRPPALAITELSKVHSKNGTSSARLSKGEGSALWASGALEQPSPERVSFLRQYLSISKLTGSRN